MAYLSKVLLIGNVGKTPEVRTFGNGDKIVSFSLATGKTYTDRNGESRKNTTWHNIQICGKLADVAEKYIKSGDMLYVEGELISRSYTANDGKERTVYEVRATGFQLLTKRESNNNDDDLPWSVREPQTVS